MTSSKEEQQHSRPVARAGETWVETWVSGGRGELQLTSEVSNEIMRGNNNKTK
jgi:hypothetical protein